MKSDEGVSPHRRFDPPLRPCPLPWRHVFGLVRFVRYEATVGTMQRLDLGHGLTLVRGPLFHRACVSVDRAGPFVETDRLEDLSR